MTGAEHLAQRALVQASLLADEQREHHHDVYSSRQRAKPGWQHSELARASASPASVSDAGQRTRVSGAAAPECPACNGAGEISFDPSYPNPL